MMKQPRILGTIAKPLGTACVLLGSLLLGACGQKGPLYLPPPAQSASSSPASPPSSTSSLPTPASKASASP